MTSEKATKVIQDFIKDELDKARLHAWISACQWIISLEGKDADCEKAFIKYMESFK